MAVRRGSGEFAEDAIRGARVHALEHLGDRRVLFADERGHRLVRRGSSR